MNAADWWPALDRAGFHVLRVLLSVQLSELRTGQ